MRDKRITLIPPSHIRKGHAAWDRDGVSTLLGDSNLVYKTRQRDWYIWMAIWMYLDDLASGK